MDIINEWGENITSLYIYVLLTVYAKKKQWLFIFCNAGKLEDLLEEADVGDNYEVDPAIQEECEPVVKVLCKDIRPGEGRSDCCLNYHLSTPNMMKCDGKISNEPPVRLKHCSHVILESSVRIPF